MVDLYEGIRLFFYRELANNGRLPSVADASDRLGVPEDWGWDGVEWLAAERHLVIDANSTIVLAPPFATRNFGFSVMGAETLWWGSCALDSFSIPLMIEKEPSAVVATTCPACGAAHSWLVDAHGPPAGDQVVHFLVPMAHVWDDIILTCENQRIFCSDACLDAWVERTGHQRGATTDIATLWRLAEHWYDGRLDSPYQRREPAIAARYFATKGLTGEFWGVPEEDESGVVSDPV